MSGLKKWFAQNWVDIGSKKKDGTFAKCGRSKRVTSVYEETQKENGSAKASEFPSGRQKTFNKMQV